MKKILLLSLIVAGAYSTMQAIIDPAVSRCISENRGNYQECLKNPQRGLQDQNGSEDSSGKVQRTRFMTPEGEADMPEQFGPGSLEDYQRRY